MIVMKFGGTSIGTARQIRTVTEIIRRHLDREPLVVVSALSGVTDTLLDASRSALKGGNILPQIRRRHHELLRDLRLPTEILDNELEQLNEILTGIAWLRECTRRTRDLVLSFGERLAAKTVASLLSQAGINAQAVPAYDLGLITDDHFHAARPLPEADLGIKRAYEEYRGPTLVVTGFIGKTEAGDITTLGRGGSDYTATILGAALSVAEVQIWTDVSGVMTADPSLVPEARSLDLLSYDEASELAYYGARVLHPATMIPARSKGIPIRVLNTMQPEHPGSLIVPAERLKPSQHIIKSIVYKEDQFLIHVTAPRRLMMHGFMARLFSIFDKYRIVVDMISTSEITVSMTLPSTTHHLEEAIRELQDFAQVKVLEGRTIMCCVGQDMRKRQGLAGRIFSCLGEAGVNIQMISQGVSEINVAFVVNNTDIEAAVKRLHGEFFGS